MIKSLGQMNQALKSYDSNSWSKKSSTELKGLDNFDEMFKGELGEVNESSETFGEFLSNSISKVNDLQLQANNAVEELAAGKTQNIAETMLTVEKAELAFKTMNQIRVKVIDAYKEIMRMQV